MSLTSPWVILFAPLVAAFLVAFGGHRSKFFSAAVSLTAVWLGLCLERVAEKS